MWLKLRWFVALMIAAGAAIAFAAQANAQSASDVIAELEDQGYTVYINWTTGYDTKPLSQCWVTNVNNPSHEPPSPGSFTTVYVDVVCPNHDYDGGFRGGIGIGFGF